MAALRGNKDVVKYLFDKGADVNSVAKHGITPLHLAAQEGPSEVIKFLIEQGGAPVDTQMDMGQTPLYKAVGKGRLPAIKYSKKGQMSMQKYMSVAFGGTNGISTRRSVLNCTWRSYR